MLYIGLCCDQLGQNMAVSGHRSNADRDMLRCYEYFSRDLRRCNFWWDFFKIFQDVIQDTNPETQEAQIDGESRSTLEKRILHYTIHQHI